MNVRENSIGFEATHPDYSFKGYGMNRTDARNNLEEKIQIASKITREQSSIKPNESRIFEITDPACKYNYGCVTRELVSLAQSPTSARNNLFELQEYL